MSELINKQINISREYHNQRIDAVLAQIVSEYSRSQISAWIKSGAITLNQQPCKPKDKTKDGDIITINVHYANSIDTDFTQSKAENIPLTIIYEDEEVLVINKPAGLVVHPGAGNKEHTLINALLHHEPQLQHIPRAGIIHRLDKDTTGLLIIAKTLTAHTSLIRQMQERSIKRDYVTLVQGYVVSGNTLDTNYGRHPRNRLKMAVTPNGRQAITHYRVNKRYKEFTLLDVELMTGRTHQIRVHMAHINHPVVGDPLYGGRVRIPAQASNALRALIQEFKRQALHARAISFYHPQTEELLSLEAPLPHDFSSLINALDDCNDDTTC